jgi:hypothetical protein
MDPGFSLRYGRDDTELVHKAPRIDRPLRARFMRAMTFACLLARNYYAPSS